eukprot:CAMPEP_0113676706 /NCGR_PEP_ID=MMETSP0038_2-20120614/8806_1 /TAXON_ID=2898 /ORGANISM="Cryptomonas paramecium" /LENGTH=68 /DNA_ID=CAMNT_0000593793 /DNA_START=303 /DNA_END=509 /DNA_ORIENTATION=+ /assembly_acc=CAM_ASM_000170
MTNQQSQQDDGIQKRVETTWLKSGIGEQTVSNLTFDELVNDEQHTDFLFNSENDRKITHGLVSARHVL